MKTFLVENAKKGQVIKVVLHNPPYENENILNKTGWKAKDCKITNVYDEWNEGLNEISSIDYIEEDNEGE